MSESDDIDEIREQKREELLESATEAAPDEPVTVESEEHFADLVSGDGVVLVDFFAEWCGPCKMMEPAIETVAEETDAVVAKVDIEAHQQLARDRGIQSVPTLFVYADGEQVETLIGAQDESTLIETVETHA